MKTKIETHIVIKDCPLAISVLKHLPQTESALAQLMTPRMTKVTVELMKKKTTDMMTSAMMKSQITTTKSQYAYTTKTENADTGYLEMVVTTDIQNNARNYLTMETKDNLVVIKVTNANSSIQNVLQFSI